MRSKKRCDVKELGCEEREKYASQVLPNRKTTGKILQGCDEFLLNWVSCFRRKEVEKSAVLQSFIEILPGCYLIRPTAHQFHSENGEHAIARV
jgi:hypothetical protein